MDPRRHIAHGFVWLGSSSLVSSIIDSVSSVAVLWFVTREEMGIATLAWSIAVVIEAFNGLGVGTALVQARTVTAEQVSSLFWYSIGIALAATATISLASPWIAELYGAATLAPMIVVSTSKLLAVGSALVPLQMLNRELKWQQISAIFAAATLLAAGVRVALAAAGFGAWALVVAHLGHGVFLALGAFLFSSFRPGLTFSFESIRGMAGFGVRVASSGIIYHFYRNADFLLVGRYLGFGALGLYRVAFEIAMSPAMALLTTVSRASFPVYARLAHDTHELGRALLFTVRTLSLLLLGVLTIVAASASDLLLLLGKGQWIQAAPATMILCGAAYVRCLAQIFPQLFHATGHPLYAVYDSIFTLLMLVSGFTVAVSFFDGEQGILAVSWAWLLSYPILIAFLLWLARQILPLSFWTYVRAILPGLGAAAALTAWLFIARSLTAHFESPALRFSMVAASGIIVYAGYVRYVIGVSPSALFKQRSQV